MVIKEDTFEAKSLSEDVTDLGFCAPLVVNCVLDSLWTAGESFWPFKSLAAKSGS